jgi:Bacterial Ig-like domain
VVRTTYFRTSTLLVAVAAAIVAATLMMAVPAWASSKLLVTEVSPKDKATDVAANSEVTATFNKAMKASTIKDTTFYLTEEGSSTHIPVKKRSYDATSKKATLIPESDLKAGATYTATITGVKSSKGVKLGGTSPNTATFADGKVTWSFTVATPEVTFQPQGSGPLNTNVEAIFSKDMDPSSITKDTFTLTQQGFSTLLPAQVTYDSATKKATLDPDSDLSDNVYYTATIKGGSDGVKDKDGNALAHDYSSTFAACSGGGVVLSKDTISPQFVFPCG